MITDNDIRIIENELGFSLYPWVKRMLQRGEYNNFPAGRMIGKTTCSILCLLLTDYDFKDIDVKSDRQKMIYIDELYHVQRLLINKISFKCLICNKYTCEIGGLHNNIKLDQSKMIEAQRAWREIIQRI